VCYQQTYKPCHDQGMAQAPDRGFPQGSQLLNNRESPSLLVYHCIILPFALSACVLLELVVSRRSEPLQQLMTVIACKHIHTNRFMLSLRTMSVSPNTIETGSGALSCVFQSHVYHIRTSRLSFAHNHDNLSGQVRSLYN